MSHATHVLVLTSALDTLPNPSTLTAGDLDLLRKRMFEVLERVHAERERRKALVSRG